MSYAPQIAGKNYAQFIVNTTSVDDTEAILDEYAGCVRAFPEAYVKFKQLDYQNVPLARIPLLRQRHRLGRAPRPTG